MKYLLALLMTMTALAEEKVFRCNLDDRARILVFEKDQIACAYDTNTGEFWKVWKANDSSKLINLSGAVYDGRHGPQPQSIGTIIEENSQHQRWKLKEIFAQYYSYSPIEKVITLHIYRPDKSFIRIIEKPLFEKLSIKRQIHVTGLKEGEKIVLGEEAINQNGTSILKFKGGN